MRIDTIILDDTHPSMINVTVDFESYYDSVCSLMKLSTIEYIHHPDFEVIGMGISLNGAPSKWIVGYKDCARVFAKLPWDRVRLICHNSIFDAAIVKWIFGYTAREYYCTMMASRPHIVPFSQSMSLAKVSDYIGTRKEKGNYAAASAKGKHLKDFTRTELADYGAYAITDTDNCWEIYQTTSQQLSVEEHQMIHMTIMKSINPTLMLDIPLLEEALVDEVTRKKLLLQKARIDKSEIMSNPKFARALSNLGVEPPRKISPTTNKETYAFAKNDLNFTALLKHENPAVRTLVEARLGAKSTIEESRLARFIEVGRCLSGWLPFPLMYYAAHTGRAGGYDKMNLQNLTRGSALRQAIVAPPGYKLVVSDLSQIEARMVAWLAGQDDLLEDFRDPTIDVYCSFGTRVFGREVTKDTKEDRFISKIGVLSLMYASGHVKFEHTVNSSGQAEINDVISKQVVDGYRTTYPRIKQLWYTLDKMLESMIAGRPQQYKCLHFVIDEYATMKQGRPIPCVLLPDGRKMYYPELYVDANKEKHYRGNDGKWKKIYGGAFLENISQALSQIIIKQAELRVAEKFKYKILASGQVHDELIYVVKEEHAEKFGRVLSQEMVVEPDWAPGIPLECETEIGDNYADAK